MKKNVGLPSAANYLLAVYELDKEEGLLWARIILARVEDHEEYVVAHQHARRVDGDGEPLWLGEWSHGHYFENLLEARKCFWNMVGKEVDE